MSVLSFNEWMINQLGWPRILSLPKQYTVALHPFGGNGDNGDGATPRSGCQTHFPRNMTNIRNIWNEIRTSTQAPQVIPSILNSPFSMGPAASPPTGLEAPDSADVSLSLSIREYGADVEGVLSNPKTAERGLLKAFANDMMGG